MWEIGIESPGVCTRPLRVEMSLLVGCVVKSVVSIGLVVPGRVERFRAVGGISDCVLIRGAP